MDESQQRLSECTNAADAKKARKKRRKYIIPPLQPKQAVPAGGGSGAAAVQLCQDDELADVEDLQMQLARALKRQRRRRGCMRVTDVTAADWCQVKACFKLLRHGKNHQPSAAMLAGTARHKELEEELYAAVLASATQAQQSVQKACPSEDPAGQTPSKSDAAQSQPRACCQPTPDPPQQGTTQPHQVADQPLHSQPAPGHPLTCSPCRASPGCHSTETLSPLKLLLSPEGADASRTLQSPCGAPSCAHGAPSSALQPAERLAAAALPHSSPARPAGASASNQQGAAAAMMAAATATASAAAAATTTALAPSAADSANAASARAAAAAQAPALLLCRPMSADLITREDWLAAALLQCAAGLKLLLRTGLAREVFVCGFAMEGFATSCIVGVVDELRLVAASPACPGARRNTDNDDCSRSHAEADTRVASHDTACYSGRNSSSSSNRRGSLSGMAISVLELKTRQDGTPPQPAMRRQARLQAMLYKQVLDCLPAVAQQPAAFFRHKRVDAGRQLCPDVAALYTGAVGSMNQALPPAVTLSHVIQHVAELTAALPPTSESLTVRWESQVDKSIIMDDVFDMDPVWLEQQISGYLAFLEGRLLPLKVSSQEQWKCERCRSAGKCSTLPYARASRADELW